MSGLSNSLCPASPYLSTQESDSQVRSPSQENIKNSDFRICVSCLTIQKLLPLECGHNFCYNCIKRNLYSQSYSIKYKEIFCWVCFKSLDFLMIFKFIDRHKILKLARIDKNEDLDINKSKGTDQDKDKDIEPGKNIENKICRICYGLFKKKFFVKLTCPHKFCICCITEYLEIKIMNKKVTKKDLTCPDCDEPLEYNLVREIMKKEMFDKYDDFLSDFFVSENNNCRISKCRNCGILVEGGINIETFICIKCERRFCQFCDEKHGEGSCKFKYAMINIEFNDKRCPKCFVRVTKDDGCNYAVCPWPGCNSKFCYVCLKPLSENEHYTHFPEGAYQDICLTQEYRKKIAENEYNNNMI